MNIWRVEKKDGSGPYVDNQDFAEDFLWEHMYGSTHPGLLQDPGFEDVMDEIDSEFSFGFKSLEQYYNWFDREQGEALDEHSFYLVKYKVKQKYVHITDVQLVFNKRKSVIIERYNIRDLENARPS